MSVDSALIEQIYLKKQSYYNNNNGSINSKDVYGGVNATSTKRSRAAAIVSPKKKSIGIYGIGPTKV